MKRVKDLIDAIYDVSNNDGILAQDIQRNEKMRDEFNLVMENLGIKDLVWMEKPVEKFKGDGEATVAKTMKLGEGSADDIDKGLKELYETHDSNFHPYTFSRMDAKVGYIDDMTPEEVEKLETKSIYMLRFGVPNEEERTA